MKAQYETNLTYRRLGPDGDMLFGQQPGTSHLTELDAMAQVIKTRLGAVAEEWWEGDPGALPYYTDIIAAPGTKARQEMIDLMIIERIMSTVGVISVSDITSSITQRHYSFQCKVQTIYGETYAEVNT